MSTNSLDTYHPEFDALDRPYIPPDRWTAGLDAREIDRGAAVVTLASGNRPRRSDAWGRSAVEATVGVIDDPVDTAPAAEQVSVMEAAPSPADTEADPAKAARTNGNTNGHVPVLRHRADPGSNPVAVGRAPVSSPPEDNAAQPPPAGGGGGKGPIQPPGGQASGEAGDPEGREPPEDNATYLQQVRDRWGSFQQGTQAGRADAAAEVQHEPSSRYAAPDVSAQTPEAPDTQSATFWQDKLDKYQEVLAQHEADPHPDPQYLENLRWSVNMARSELAYAQEGATKEATAGDQPTEAQLEYILDKMRHGEWESIPTDHAAVSGDQPSATQVTEPSDITSAADRPPAPSTPEATESGEGSEHIEVITTADRRILADRTHPRQDLINMLVGEARGEPTATTWQQIDTGIYYPNRRHFRGLTEDGEPIFFAEMTYHAEVGTIGAAPVNGENEIRISQAIDRIVDTDEAQRAATEQGFAGITYIRPLVVVSHGNPAGEIKTYQYIPGNRLPEAESWFQSQPAGDVAALVRTSNRLKEILRSYGVHPGSLEPRQFLAIPDRTGRNHLFLTGAERYSEI